MKNKTDSETTRPTEANANNDSTHDDEARLDAELQLVRKMRLAFTSSLHMLEAARDDLIAMGLRMDRLQQASQLCRTALQSDAPKITKTTANNEKSQEFVRQGK